MRYYAILGFCCFVLDCNKIVLAVYTVLILCYIYIIVIYDCMYVRNIMYQDVAISVCISCIILKFLFAFLYMLVCVCVMTIMTKGRIIIINLYHDENKLNRQKCMVSLKCKNEWGGNVSKYYSELKWNSSSLLVADSIYVKKKYVILCV